VGSLGSDGLDSRSKDRLYRQNTFNAIGLRVCNSAPQNLSVTGAIALFVHDILRAKFRLSMAHPDSDY